MSGYGVQASRHTYSGYHPRPATGMAWTCKEMHSTNGGVSCLDVIKAVAALFFTDEVIFCLLVMYYTVCTHSGNELETQVNPPHPFTISDDSGPAAMHTGGASHTSPPILFAGFTAALVTVVTAALVGSRCPR